MKEAIKNIFESRKSDNIIGVGRGRKQQGGVYTENEAIVFTVLEKKPVEQINPDELIPSEINIDGVMYKTDVVIGGKMYLLSSVPPIDYDQPFDDWRHIDPANKGLIDPIQGGLEIEPIATSAGGTGGVLCKDNDTGAICMLTNCHVISGDTLKISDRVNADIPHYETKHITNGNRIIGRFYKSPFVYKNSANLTDSALFTIREGLYDVTESRKQIGMTPLNVTKFATTSELDTIGPGTRIYSSGRTTGGKGETGYFPPDPREHTVKLFVEAINYATPVGEYERPGYVNNFIANFTDGIKYKATETDYTGTPLYGVSRPGDSGSAVYADFGGEMKIVGLLSASDMLSYAVFCRIDHICEAMNISEWPVDPVNPFQNELLPSLDDEAPEYYDVAGIDPDPFKIVGGKKYWAIGTLRK